MTYGWRTCGVVGAVALAAIGGACRAPPEKRPNACVSSRLILAAAPSSSRYFPDDANFSSNERSDQWRRASYGRPLRALKQPILPRRLPAHQLVRVAFFPGLVNELASIVFESDEVGTCMTMSRVPSVRWGAKPRATEHKRVFRRNEKIDLFLETVSRPILAVPTEIPVEREEDASDTLIEFVDRQGYIVRAFEPGQQCGEKSCAAYELIVAEAYELLWHFMPETNL